MLPSGERLSLALHDTSNYGYEGCHARYLAWYGDTIVVVTQEQTNRYLFAIRKAESRHRAIGDFVIDGELIFWCGYQEPGLISSAHLPSLDDAIPLPLRSSVAGLRLSREGHQIAVRHSSALLERVTLPAAHQRGARMTIGALAPRLKHELHRTERHRTDDELLTVVVQSTALCFSTTRTRTSPTWLPAYWCRFLRETNPSKAERLLSALESIAARTIDGLGWNREAPFVDGYIELALQHVRRRAAANVDVARSGELPGRHCLLFAGHAEPELFPHEMRTVFDAISATKPPEFKTRW